MMSECPSMKPGSVSRSITPSWKVLLCIGRATTINRVATWWTLAIVACGSCCKASGPVRNAMYGVGYQESTIAERGFVTFTRDNAGRLTDIANGGNIHADYNPSDR